MLRYPVRRSVLMISENHWTGFSRYLQDNFETFTFIYYKHPSGYAGGPAIECKSYQNGTLVRSEYFLARRASLLLAIRRIHAQLLGLIEYLYAIALILRSKKRYDLFITANYTLVTWLAPRLKLGYKSVIVSCDVVLNTNSIIKKLKNTIFLGLERVVEDSADAVWYLTPEMLTMKKRQGIARRNNIPRMVVPMPIAERISSQFEEIQRHQIVYFGYVGPRRGLELAIESLNQIIHKVPDVTLTIIGLENPVYSSRLKSEIAQRGLSDHIKFVGYVEDMNKVRKIISKSAVGIAIYDSQTLRYGQSNRFLEYLACGVPVVVNKEINLWSQVVQTGAGIVIDYDLSQLTRALLDLLTDDVVWANCREGVAKMYDVLRNEKKYEYALSELLGLGVKSR
jgi:glycosyltransferase involved in cell wall biosynthesis